jgi:hypothetical protein
MSTLDLDALLAGGPARSDEERRLLAAIEALRAAPPHAPERLRLRVAEQRPEPARRLPAPRRLLFLAVPAAAALAVAAAVIHGLAGSSEKRPTVVASPTVEQKAAVPPAWSAGAGTDSAAGGGSATGRYSLAPTVQRGIAAPTPPRGRLTRYLASITIRVPGGTRLPRATNEATAVARALGGYAASVEYRTPAGRPGAAYLELRVPTNRVQDALARLGGLGTLVSQRVSVQDLQNQLERQSAQIAQLRREIRLLTEALRSPSLTPLQRVQLQLRLGDAKRALAQRTHARGATIAEGTLARISLVLTEAKAGAVVPHHRGRLGRLVHGAFSFLALEATIALYALIVVAPLLLLAALAWWGALARRRRDERRLLSASS